MRDIRALLRFCADELGVASIYMLCMLPVFLVILGLGMDGAAAFRTQNLLQSTADASALAAAKALGLGASPLVTAAKQAAADYAAANMSSTAPPAGFGFVLNANAASNGDLTLGNWASNTFTPDGSPLNAVRVTVRTATANSNALATTFLSLVGKASWDVGASATAMIGVPKPICILAFTSFLSDGLPGGNLAKCTIAGGTLTCNGSNSDGGAAFGFFVTADNGCGAVPAKVSAVVDPYASLAVSNNLAAQNTCGGSYPGMSSGSLPPLTSSPLVVCGDLTMAGNVSLTPAAGGSVIVIENGQLNTSGNTLSATNSNGLTIIFSGTQASAATHQVTGNGTLSFSAPTSGAWSNIAIYQDPSLLPPADLDYKPRNPGQKIPSLNVSGIIYMKRANFELHGSAGNNNPSACIVIVADVITIKGTGDVLAQKGCTNAPTALAPISVLVQ